MITIMITILVSTSMHNNNFKVGWIFIGCQSFYFSSGGKIIVLKDIPPISFLYVIIFITVVTELQQLLKLYSYSYLIILGVNGP